ncbi:MAG: zf-HC2 domain-containing protein [Lachnospiraceae bacterium]|nr:zf-HC2 domain-containing protein [Lachnospiraceae bacterium]
MKQEKSFNTCEIVQDLLPLYIDEACSEESKKVVEGHVEECSKCHKYIEQLKSSIIENSFSEESEHIIANHKRKIRNLMIGIGCLCIVVSVLIMSLGWIFIQSFDSIAEEYMTIKTEEYGNWDGHIEGEREYLESGLYIFPEQIDMAKEAKYYYYCSNDNSSISQYLIYTEVTYSEEDYMKEKERLANTKCQVKLSPAEGSVTNSVLYSEELFAYPAYIAVYSSNLSYEYALIDEQEERIIYVYMQMKDGNEVLPKEFLPLEYQGKDMYEENSWDNVNIYFGKDKYGDYSYFMDAF